MEKSKIFKMILSSAGVFCFFILFISCEKTKYNLRNPAEAGLWSAYSTSNGLQGNGINDLFLDSKGMLWVAFSGGNGLASFDGSTWTSYKTSNSGILSNSVTSLAEDKYGTLIVGTLNGLSFRAENNQWSSYQDPPRTMRINDIKVTSTGEIWVGTQSQGFYYNDGSGFVQVYSASFQNVNSIEEDNSGNVWLGTDNGLLKWDGSNFSVLTTSNGLPENEVEDLYFDSKNRLWIATTGGNTVTYIDSEKNLFQVSLMNGPYGLFVMDIFEDRRGDMWFATWFDGLVRYDGAVSHSYKEYNGFAENDVNVIAEDKDGNLWFGLYSMGLLKYTLPLE